MKATKKKQKKRRNEYAELMKEARKEYLHDREKKNSEKKRKKER